jgi:geranylgeranyl pyrophosphate synthase
MNFEVEKLLQENSLKINKMIERYIPRKYQKNSLVFSIIPPRYDYDLVALNEALAKPIWDFLDRGGKRWRPTLFLLVVEVLGNDPNQFTEFAVIPEVVHNGTIMIDDVQDRSDFRRGKPSTHVLFGLDIATNAANFMYYMPVLTLIKNRNSLSAEKTEKIYETYVEEMVKLSFGQAMDIAWHKGIPEANKITEKQYLQMCAYKTGTLARMAAKIAAILCDANKETTERLGNFAEAIGVAFQIQDDILDLVSSEFADKKGGRGQDITKGKRTLMVIHTLDKAESSDKERLIEILDSRPVDQALRDEAISIMRKYKSVEYAKELAKDIIAENWKAVNKLLPPSNSKKKFKAFADYLVERTI